MYQEITQSDFTAEFHRAGRGTQFSHAALLALYEYLEENYGFELDADATEEQNEDAAMDFLRNKTSVIEFVGGIAIVNC